MVFDTGHVEMMQVCEARCHEIAKVAGLAVGIAQNQPNSVVSITKENFQKEVLESKLPVILDVYLPWCGPCKAATPIFEELSQVYRGQIKFARMNLDAEGALGTELGVDRVPTFLFYQMGQLIERSVGGISRERMIHQIESIFNLDGRDARD